MRLRTFDDGGRLLEGACRRYQRPMSVDFPTNRRDYIIFPGVFISHGRGGGGRGGKKVVDCRALRGRGALVAPEIGRDGSRPSRISCLLHFYTSTRPFLRRRGRRRYGCRCWRGRTPLATACAAHFVRGICRYGRDAIHRVRACRLRSVATSATLPLPTTLYQLPSTNYPLPTSPQLRAHMGGCQFTSE